MDGGTLPAGRARGLPQARRQALRSGL